MSQFMSYVIVSNDIRICVMTDAPGALEMTWLQVKPEELMEPKVTVVMRAVIIQ